MKVMRFFGVLFCIVGLVLMLGTVGLCLGNLDTQPGVGDIPQEVLECFEAVLDSVENGEFAAAAVRMYGWPEAGADRAPEGVEVRRLWDAYLDSLEWEALGGFYATGRGFARKCQVKALDVLAVAGKAEEYARTALNERISTAEDMMSLYDENLDFRPELIDGVMEEGLEKALAEPGMVKAVECTVEVLYRDGQWWFIPDENLIAVMNAGLGEGG